MMKIFINSMACLTLFAMSSSTFGALPNHNKVFQLAELSVIKVELLAQQAGAPMQKIKIPDYQNPLPKHLYAEAIEVYDQIRKLQKLNGVNVMPAQTLPDESMRTANVYALLELINESLNRVLVKKGIERPVELERVHGKSIEHNYAALWYLTRTLTTMVPSAHMNMLISMQN